MKSVVLVLALILAITGFAFAQGNAFSFQGKLNDGANPANGRYDLEFKLFDAVTGGTQIGPTVTRPNTTLINGVFSVVLDFGAAAFQNPNSIFIEIAIKPNGSPNQLTILGPRQQLTVVPYASRAQNATNADNSQNALNLNGQPSSSYARLTQGVVVDNQGDLRIGGTLEGNKIRIGIIAGAIDSSVIAGDLEVQWGDVRISQNVFGTGGDLSVGGNLQVFGNASVNRNLQLNGQIDGNARQNLNGNGLVKATLRVNADGSVASCYNAVANLSTGNCGFSITFPLGVSAGVYRINFGFTISNRVVSVSAEFPASGFNKGANYRYFDSSNIEVFTFNTNSDSTSLNGFTLILY